MKNLSETFTSLQFLSSRNENKSLMSMRACMRTLNMQTISEIVSRFCFCVVVFFFQKFSDHNKSYGICLAFYWSVFVLRSGCGIGTLCLLIRK